MQSLTECGAQWLVTLAGHRTPAPRLYTSKVLELQSCVTMPRYLHGCWESNLSTHPCAASTSSTELS